jgi:hypothetical protein
VSSAADFEDLLWNLMGATSCDDLKEALRDTVDHRTIPAAAVAWLAEVIGVDALVAGLVEAKVAEHAGCWEGPCWDAPDRTSIYYEDEAHPVDAVPLYRIGRDRA